MNKVSPITPSGILEAKAAAIPDFIIEAFNEQISVDASPDGKYAVITQSDVISRIIKKNPAFTIKKLFDEKLLDVESIFRSFGWKVFHDKPGYNENYEATWKFTWEG